MTLTMGWGGCFTVINFKLKIFLLEVNLPDR
jgi:hypothetical protein